jgi:hypothetical protein
MSRVIGPPTDPPDVSWFAQAFLILFAVQQSGTTAQRPTKQLWIGRTYWDLDLDLPIWVKAISPAVVWVDAAGNTV